MASREVPIEPGHIYHIYNRGVNKEDIFFSERNYQYFIERMFQYLSPRSELIAYCLMPNHFHLLVKVTSSDFTKLSLQLFLMSYSKAINSERDRVGSLFQGRYKANLIVDDAHFLDCFKYIHLNPVKAHLAQTPELWPYSSYSEYLSTKSKPRIDPSLVMQFFDTKDELRAFIESGIEEYRSKYFREEM